MGGVAVEVLVLGFGRVFEVGKKDETYLNLFILFSDSGILLATPDKSSRLPSWWHYYVWYAAKRNVGNPVYSLSG